MVRQIVSCKNEQQQHPTPVRVCGYIYRIYIPVSRLTDGAECSTRDEALEFNNENLKTNWEASWRANATIVEPSLIRHPGRFRWLPRVSRATAEDSVVSQVDRPGSTMVVPVGQMGILSAHAWCCISVKHMWKKRMIYVDPV